MGRSFRHLSDLLLVLVALGAVATGACVPDPRHAPVDGDSDVDDEAGAPLDPDASVSDPADAAAAVSVAGADASLPVKVDAPAIKIDAAVVVHPPDAPIILDAPAPLDRPPALASDTAPAPLTCPAACDGGCPSLVCRDLASNALTCAPGGWSFESGTPEGWVSSSRASGVGVASVVPGHPHGGNDALAQTLRTGNAAIQLVVDLCGGAGGRAAVRGRRISLWYYFDNAVPPSANPTVGLSLYQDSENARATLVPLVRQQWTLLTDSYGTSLGDGDESPRIGFTLLGNGGAEAYAATVYIDDVTIE